jgi:transposase-like protein
MDMQETRDRMCPYCRNRAGVALGRILASATGIRCDYRCPSCSKDFVVLAAPPPMVTAAAERASENS